METNITVDKSGYFLESYNNWSGYGYGIMIIHISSSRKVEYVLWRQERGYKKVIINEKLLEQYNSDNVV